MGFSSEPTSRNVVDLIVVKMVKLEIPPVVYPGLLTVTSEQEQAS